jgi:hypothetical protein
MTIDDSARSHTNILEELLGDLYNFIDRIYRKDPVSDRLNSMKVANVAIIQVTSQPHQQPKSF